MKLRNRIKVRFKFLSWLNRKVARTPIGVVPPKWVRIIAWILGA